MVELTDRQYGTSLNQIRGDHVERYAFAVKQIKGKKNILDAACGCGYGSKMLFDAGHDVTGLDISEHAIEYARRNWAGPNYIKNDIKKFLEQTRAHYDAIVCFETIEHLEEDREVAELFLGRADTLIISCPNQNARPFKPEDFAGDKFPHLRHYTPEELENLLSGWNIEAKFSQEKSGEFIAGDNGRYLVYVCRRPGLS